MKWERNSITLPKSNLLLNSSFALLDIQNPINSGSVVYKRNTIYIQYYNINKDLISTEETRLYKLQVSEVIVSTFLDSL